HTLSPAPQRPGVPDAKRPRGLASPGGRHRLAVPHGRRIGRTGRNGLFRRRSNIAPQPRPRHLRMHRRRNGLCHPVGVPTRKTSRIIFGELSLTMVDIVPISRALLSVSDKMGLIPFAQSLREQKVELLSTGGTYKALRDAGLEVTEVSAHTAFPEM